MKKLVLLSIMVLSFVGSALACEKGWIVTSTACSVKNIDGYVTYPAGTCHPVDCQ